MQPISLRVRGELAECNKCLDAIIAVTRRVSLNSNFIVLHRTRELKQVLLSFENKI